MRYFEGFYQKNPGENFNATKKTICKLAGNDIGLVNSPSNPDKLSPLENLLEFLESLGIEHIVLPPHIGHLDNQFFPSVLLRKSNLFILILDCIGEEVFCWDSEYGSVSITKKNLAEQFGAAIVILDFQYAEKWKFTLDYPDCSNKSLYLKGRQASPLQIEESIFVSVAAYRDEEYLPTLINLYETAANPEKIRVFCLYQIDFNKDHVPAILPKCLDNFNIEIQYISHLKSRGVCWARSQIQQHINNEKYYLQIDSHMRFANNWDNKLKKQLKLCHSKKAIISCYPQGYCPPNKISGNHLSISLPFRFNAGCVIFKGFKPKDHVFKNLRPVLHYFISGGFHFTTIDFVKEVPYDPYLYFIGEETDLSVRAFTFGWDSYSPSECLMWHYYYVNGENNRTLHWEDDKEYKRLSIPAHLRLQYKLGIIEHVDSPESIENIDAYQLGTTRKLEDFEAITQISFRERKIFYKDECGSIGN